MDQSIDIVMTTTLRPSVVERTISSIVKRICKDNIDRFNFIFNVDPVGEDGVSQTDIVDVVRKYFPNATYNTPSRASFPLAVKWTWGQASTPFVLHTEDALEIAKDIDINHMIAILKKYPKLATLRLDRGIEWENPQSDMGGEHIERAGCLWKYNPDGFYHAPQWKGAFATCPSLFRREFIHSLVPFMQDGISPERITMCAGWLPRKIGKEKFRELYRILRSWQAAHYAVPLVLKDLGRPWRETHGFTKPLTKRGKHRGISTTWVKT